MWLAGSEQSSRPFPECPDLRTTSTTRVLLAKPIPLGNFLSFTQQNWIFKLMFLAFYQLINENIQELKNILGESYPESLSRISRFHGGGGGASCRACEVKHSFTPLFQALLSGPGMSLSQAPTDSPCQSIYTLCLRKGALHMLSTEFFKTKISFVLPEKPTSLERFRLYLNSFYNWKIK